MVLTFEELRQIKDKLPHGSIKKIAEELHLEEDTVRNYFGATHFEHGSAAIPGVFYEKGGAHGVVRLEDTRIYESAMKILKNQN